MPSNEIRSIALTMVVCFAVSFGIMYWQRKAQISAVTSASVPSMPSPGAQAEAQGAMPQGPRREPIPAPVAAVPRPAPAAPANPDAASSDAGAEQPPQPLPVAFHIWNRHSQHRIEGDIMNGSSEPLTVTLRVESASTQQSTESSMSFEPGEKKTFSTDSGLTMHSGDRLVLLSPPYQERVAQVP
jgi:hypothetical protein